MDVELVEMHAANLRLESQNMRLVSEVCAALETIEIPDQGHAPLLTEADTIARIVEFVGRCDASPGVGGKKPAPALSA